MDREQHADRLLDGISELLSIDPDRLARVAGQFITRTAISLKVTWKRKLAVYVRVIPRYYSFKRKAFLGGS
jgi:hypothetical protein